MKKLQLHIEELDIETFETTKSGGKEKGTVFANSLNPNCGHTPDQACLVTEDYVCIPFTDSPYCDPTYTCDTATECTYAQ